MKTGAPLPEEAAAYGEELLANALSRSVLAVTTELATHLPVWSASQAANKAPIGIPQWMLECCAASFGQGGSISWPTYCEHLTKRLVELTAAARFEGAPHDMSGASLAHLLGKDLHALSSAKLAGLEKAGKAMEAVIGAAHV